MINRNFIFLINPVSGTKTKEGLTGLIEARCALYKAAFQVLHTNAAGDYAYLKEKIKQEKITDVVICGGDGSVNQVVGSLLGTDVSFGIIPMGSGNGLALAAGIPVKASKALGIIFKGKSSYIDALYVNSAFSCMLCGLGFDAQVAHDFAKHPKRGLSTYVKLTIRNFLKARFYPFEITMNGQTIQPEALFISIANSNQFGNNFTIAPKASLNDGMLDIVIVNRMNRFKMIVSVLMQVRAGKVQAKPNAGKTGVQYFQAKELIIKNPGSAPMHIDGEPVTTSKHINIKIIENAFKLLQP